MPVYFFHFTAGRDTLADEDGMELADVQAARREARAAARELAKASAGRAVSRWQDWSVRVTDDAGSQVVQIAVRRSWRLAGEMSPAASDLEEQIVRCRQQTVTLLSRNLLLRRQLDAELQKTAQRKISSRAIVARAAAQTAGRNAPQLCAVGGHVSGSRDVRRPRLSLVIGDKSARSTI